MGKRLDPANFGELIWRAVASRPEKVAIEQDDLSLTYAELDARVKRFANVLQDFGVEKGDRVLLLLPNDFRFVECLLGTLRAGAVAVPANIKLAVETLTYIADDSEAKLLVGHADLTEKTLTIHRSASTLRSTMAIGGPIDGAESYELLLDQARDRFETLPVDESDLALLMYTSGSTGLPKGCMLSHGNKWWQARSSARTMMLNEADKALVMGPLFHANALWACLLPMLYVAGGVAILPGFEPKAVLTGIDQYRPTFTSGTPSMFSLLLGERELLSKVDLSSIKLLLCGSAPVGEELMARLIARFDCDVVESYGLTEGGANVVTPRWGIKKVGSTGLPVPDVEIRVVDPENPARECDSGEVGELLSRSPANALGYWKQLDLTAMRFDAQGWLRTGDLVRRDEQGYVYFCGRVDDMINCGGENVYPKEVENVLLAHPDVDDVCVVPVEHAVKGQAPVAWVVRRPGSSLTEDELKEFFLARGPAYAHPRRVFLVDELPISGTNKVDRARLIAETRDRLPEGLSTSLR